MANGSGSNASGDVQGEVMKGFSMARSLAMVVFFLVLFFGLMLVFRAKVPGINQARKFARDSLHA